MIVVDIEILLGRQIKIFGCKFYNKCGELLNFVLINVGRADIELGFNRKQHFRPISTQFCTYCGQSLNTI